MRGLIDIYRESICQRYQLERLRRFPEYDSLSDRTVESLRGFFLDQLYPPSAERQDLDEAFDAAIALARSPAKLLPMTGTALRSLWRLGRQLPAAMSAGAATLEAFRETRRLEAALQGHLDRNGLTPADLEDPQQFARMIAGVPRREVERFRGEVLRLFRTLGNVPLLETTLRIFEQCLGVMRRKTERYSDAERSGFRLGCGVLSGGIVLFGALDSGQVPLILQAIERIEIDWYEAMLAHA